MARAKVMVADSSVSAPQMMDFWRKVSDGTIDSALFQSFLSNPRRFAKEVGGVTYTRAVNILGADRVVNIGDAARVRGVAPFDPTIPIRYSEVTLRGCAEENKTRKADWRLTYCFGKSLRELREQIGTDPEKQPCAYKDNNWWLNKKEDGWAMVRPEADYYLTDWTGRWLRTSWNDQEKLIVGLGDSVTRTHEAVIAESMTTIFQVHGVRLLENWYHWGPSLDSVGSRVCIGFFARLGWRVSGLSPDWDDFGSLRVCLSRKFEF